MNKNEQFFGFNALERMAEAPNFNHWMYQTIAPFIHGKILEVGSGTGNLSSYFLHDQKNITLTDYDEAYVELLKEKFSSYQREKIFQMDIADTSFKEKNKLLENAYDAVFLLNVLEHIEDDAAAIENCSFLLKQKGCLLILVPAYSFLFSEMDRLLGHYRRYTAASLKKIVTGNGFAIEKTFYFNTLGIAGWWWNQFFNQAEISQKKMRVYNRLIPFAKLLDKIFFHKTGLSVITVAKKI